MAMRSIHRFVAIGALGVGVLLVLAFARLTGWSVQVRTFQMASGAMREALLPGDFIFVDVAHRPVRRGEVVAIKCAASDGWCVYRLVALAGDTVAVRGHRAYLNGVPLIEPYATTPRSATDSIANRSPIVVPSLHAWVLGDNRAESYDSRFWGSVPLEQVHGRPVSIYWSWDREGGRVRWGRIGRRIR